MKQILHTFEIDGLHNTKTVKVHIKDNKLILVGENGTGKSTVANLIYFFLTRQWEKVVGIEFQRIHAKGDQLDITIIKKDLLKYYDSEHQRLRDYLIHRIPRTTIYQLEKYVAGVPIGQIIENPADIATLISKDLDIPRTYIYEFLSNYIDREGGGRKETPLRKIEAQLEEILDINFLYLPTYRRIEQDLRSIFPGLEEELKIPIQRRAKKIKSAIFQELVEFGMEDVETLLKDRVAEVKEDVRNGLNNLTGLYLRDVIRRDYKTSQLIRNLAELDNQTIDSIFARMPEAILGESELSNLRKTIERIRDLGEVPEDDKVIAHFVTQLLDLYKKQNANEKDIREFTKVCNSYLTGKSLVYDNVTFEIYISQIDKEIEQRLPLKALSSGEKQIVSLFSQIYLSKIYNYFVIIDEPELSLSVPWQQKFLPDILASGRCNGLIAVTHSPFVYQNELQEFTHSIEEFISKV